MDTVAIACHTNNKYMIYFYPQPEQSEYVFLMELLYQGEAYKETAQ
jgi:hypothetical protein